MSQLPKSWGFTTVGEICREINYGYTASASEERCGPRFLRITDIQNGSVNWERVPYCEIENGSLARFLLKVGDIVFARTGGTVGKSYIIRSVPEDAVFASYLIRLTAANDVFPAFLYHYFQSAAYWEQIGLKKGGLQGNVNATTLSSLQIPICSSKEQKRIVTKIEELFSELEKGIESLETAREQLKIYRQAVLKYAFEGKLTVDWREKNKNKLEPAEQLLSQVKIMRENQAKKLKFVRLKNPRNFDDEDFSWLPELPEEWTWNRLGWITCGVEYGTAAKSAEVGKVPVLRMGNIQNAKFVWDDLVFTSDEDEIQKYMLKPGDVLFNRTNSPELVGKTAIYRGERPALFAGYLIRVNQIERVVDSQFLNLFLNSHVAKQYGNSVKTDGVNQSNINGEKLINYPFPYCSLGEQKAIVKILEERLSQVDRMEAEIDVQLQKSEALRQSILKKAFSGKLVTQDPNDEPAGLLLEHIRAEKEEQSGKKKINGKRKAA